MNSKLNDLLMSFLLVFAVTAHLLLVSPLYILILNYGEFPNSIFHIIAKSLFMVTCVVAPFLTLIMYAPVRRGWYRGLALFLACALYLYIQFHFFTWDYGIFDGREILWSQYAFADFIEIPALVILCALALVFPRKFYTHALAVLLLLFAAESAYTVIKYMQLRPNFNNVEAGLSASPRAIDYFTTNEQDRSRANVLSEDTNVIVILADTLQSDIFQKIIEKHPALREKFKGFVFFRNSSGLFPYTVLSVPAIFTGQPYKFGDLLSSYFSSVKADRIDTILSGNGFLISSLPLDHDGRAQYLDSISARSYGLASIFDIVLFRHSPNLLKPIVFNDYKFIFRPIFLSDIPATQQETDLKVLRSLIAHSYKGKHKKEFKFLHLWGMHPPAILDRECRVVEPSHKRSRIEDQAVCIISLITDYLERLQDLGVYDRSLIMLIADTGSKYPISSVKQNNKRNDIPEFVMSSAHPLIAVKDFDQQEGLRISDAPVSLIDIPKTILSSLKIHTEKPEGFDMFSLKEQEERTRSFYYYKGSDEAVHGAKVPQMQEFLINGFIRDIDAWSVGTFYSSLTSGNEIMHFVDFGDVTSSKFQDLGWSVEANGVISSWTITPSAALIGKLPDKESIRMVTRFYNPHAGQKVHIRLNGRTVATWHIDKPTGYREYSTVIQLSEEDRQAVSRVEFITDTLGAINDKDERELGIFVDWVRFE